MRLPSLAPLRFQSRSMLLLACLTASACGLGLTTAGAQETVPPASPRKVLILGNSITKHGPKADIGWTGNWGMAASAEEKDFVHLIMRALSGDPDSKPQFLVKNIAAFERNYATYGVEAGLKDAIAFGPDLIILAIGENVPALTTEEAKTQFKGSVGRLLTALKAGRGPTIIVRSSFWANPAKDQALSEACKAAGGVFVDISPLSKDESNYARSERPFKHEGVARHPGDKGMQAIAEAILGAIGKH